MNLTIENENYSASVVILKHIFDIEGADFIKKAVVNGNSVIVSKDAKEGDKMIYFISGTALSPELCFNNDLYESQELNLNKDKRGYVSSKQRRVRAIKLRGVVSDGLLLPVGAVNYLGVDGATLQEGDSFTHINDTEVCYKYVAATSAKGQSGGTQKAKGPKLGEILIPGQFRLHHETAHLGRNLFKFNLDDEIVITDKLHGSSVILSNVLVKRQLTLVERIAKYFGAAVVEEEYTGIYSSGKPKSGLPKGIISKWFNVNKSFYSDDIWKTCYNDFEYALQKGITIYGEVVGNHVQKGFDYSKLHNRDGYGFLVYRIARTNVDGKVDEFTWNQVEDYCENYQLSTVPVVYKGTLRNWVNGAVSLENEADIDQIRESIFEAMKKRYLEKNCPYCVNKMPAEGVCVRKERPYDVYKLKSDAFKLLENKNQEDGVTDTEEEA